MAGFTPHPAYDLAHDWDHPKDARNCLNRWNLVREVEASELRGTSMETKARQLAVLTASRDVFRQDQTRDREIVDVRARWGKIRSAMRG